MTENILNDLAVLGQSIWLDNINRKLIETGRLKQMINSGLRGMTSNPSIFDKAISKSSDYDKYIKKLDPHPQEKSAFEIYDELTIKDIQDAADLFKIVYEKSNGLDGHVSLEINPKIAFDSGKTVQEGKRLYKKVNRENLMLKVPATDEGFAAIEELTGAGISVNVTLIFSLAQYKKAANAYINGLKKLLQARGDMKKIRSVASVFVSRVDTSIDKQLDILAGKENDKENILSLKGRAAVANSQMIYSEFLEIFSSDEFKELSNKGANVQRPLWASTSTKNPKYSDVKYVEELIGRDTVNTLPDDTYTAFLDHGKVKNALTAGISSAKAVLDALRSEGIDIDEVCDKLLRDGVTAFVNSFESLLGSVEQKTKILAG